MQDPQREEHPLPSVIAPRVAAPQDYHCRLAALSALAALPLSLVVPVQVPLPVLVLVPGLATVSLVAACPWRVTHAQTRQQGG